MYSRCSGVVIYSVQMLACVPNMNLALDPVSGVIGASLGEGVEIVDHIDRIKTADSQRLVLCIS